ncbi:MAG: hypothetical protein ISN29_02015 [Gammaproteobacteria bacterium AqS3]|nr:hypothetical protein [Gammaproteobacteria bacterium AqS3]
MNGWLMLWIALALLGFAGFSIANLWYLNETGDPLKAVALATISLIIGIPSLYISIVWFVAFGVHK